MPRLTQTGAVIRRAAGASGEHRPPFSPLPRRGLRMTVECMPLIRGLLRDDSLTRGLGDIEARMLVDWVTDWAELLIGTARTLTDAQTLVARLVRRGKAIARFVQLYCDFNPGCRGAASQLAATEQFAWPLPTDSIEAPDLMKSILTWENEHR